MTLFELLLSWPVLAQFLLFVVVVTSLTYLTEVFMRSISRDFMNALTILVRGWPPAHIKADDEDEDDDLTKDDDKQ